MAAALAERAVAERGLEGRATVVSGGTEPADGVHEVVVEAMAEVGLDVAGRTPRAHSRDEPLACDVVVTMGCAAEDVCPATWRGDVRDWGLDDPAGRPLEAVRDLRDEIERRVEELVEGLVARGTRNRRTPPNATANRTPGAFLVQILGWGRGAA